MLALLSKRVVTMATITVRDLPDEVRDRLRVRAAGHGRSMEAEVRAILAEAVVDVRWVDTLVSVSEGYTTRGEDLADVERDLPRPVDLS